MTDFCKGIIAGAVASLVLFGVAAAVYFARQRDKELVEYAEKRIEIEALRDEVYNRSPSEFLDDNEGVRRAADDANAEFERKRNEAVRAIRQGRIAR